jgi:hypothetical protein
MLEWPSRTDHLADRAAAHAALREEVDHLSRVIEAARTAIVWFTTP